MNGALPPPGKKGELFMPAWGQIMSAQGVAKILPYIQEGPRAGALPTPPAATPAPLAGEAQSTSGSP